MSERKRGMTVEGKIEINYKWSVGRAGERFFTEIRDNKRIMGSRCRQCRRLLVPPRIFCEECFVEDMEWVEVPPRGTLVTFGDCYFSTDGKRLRDPWMLGIVKLEGSDGGLIHFLGECQPEELRIGMPMEAVFREKREGSILDILYFRPLQG